MPQTRQDRRRKKKIMPDKSTQTSRNTRNRAHTTAPATSTASRWRTSTLQMLADWRNASGKAPDSLLPGVASGFSNGDRRCWS
jgi:hypothetical protein